VSEDRTLPRIVLAGDDTFATVKVTPRCSVDGVEVDITDPDHHVCVTDDAGAIVKKATAREAHDEWKLRYDAFQAAEQAKIAAAAAEPAPDQP